MKNLWSTLVFGERKHKKFQKYLIGLIYECSLHNVPEKNCLARFTMLGRTISHLGLLCFNSILALLRI